jgi:DHA1 family bicyclomycin/chloramphenicol resistance-like MFS transporter
MFGPLSVDFYLPAFPQIADELHTSASAVQLSLTATLLGIAVGQVLIGPLSDRLGRRPPLFAGLTAFVLASAACAAAPDIQTLDAIRFVQGLGGAAGLVIAFAVVRDQFSGTMAVRFFSALLTVTVAGPLFAPQIGAALLHLGSWRTLFIALAVGGTALIGVAAVKLPETLAPDNRHRGGVISQLSTIRAVLADRGFLVNSLVNALSTGALFAYIAGAPFALENVHGLSPQQFSLVFAVNALGLVCSSQVNGALVGRFGPSRLLAVGLTGLGLCTGALLLGAVAGFGGLALLLVCTFSTMACIGFILPNTSALALAGFPDAAGSASSVLGLLRFGAGALMAPLVGMSGSRDVLPMAAVMAVCGLAAMLLRLTVSPDESLSPPSSSPVTD